MDADKDTVQHWYFNTLSINVNIPENVHHLMFDFAAFAVHDYARYSWYLTSCANILEDSLLPVHLQKTLLCAPGAKGRFLSG